MAEVSLGNACIATLPPESVPPPRHLLSVFPLSQVRDVPSHFADGCSKLVPSNLPKGMQKSANAVA